MIQLIGPGGAGKSTAGAALAERINIPFIDLDLCFLDRVGDISLHIQQQGYEAYARQNVEVYGSLAAEVRPLSVMALSSGFMTYADDIHPAYFALRARIEASPTTFVLLPSLDEETCVTEIVRRQLTRPFGGSAESEEAVIRKRFSIYMGVPARKVETGRPVSEVVDEIVGGLPPNSALHPAARFARGG